MKVMTVYGTRPEAIKVAPVIRAFDTDPRFQSIPVVTGQHREMLDQVNRVFGIEPVHDMDIFEPGQSLNALMSKVFHRIHPVFDEYRPDAVLVQGDTSTVAASAIAAFYAGIPVVHLEAGLRSGDISSPFPEEANRKLTTQVSALHLAPTTTSRANLTAEAVNPDTIAVTGNTVIDALLLAVSDNEPPADPALAEAVAAGKPILLVTTHRRENWGEPMANIGRAVARLAKAYPEQLVILPAHKNPVMRQAVLPHIEGLDNVMVTEPLPYGDFTKVMKAAHIILTDSGGVQEEAPSLGKPVLVLRENTERPEAVEAGTVRLIGTDEDRIFAEVSRLVDDADRYATMANAVNPYGDGRAAERTVAAVSELLGIGLRMPDFAAEQVAVG